MPIFKLDALPIFKLDATKIRKIRRVVPQKKFKQMDKERNGHACKQVNRQIDKHSNRKKKEKEKFEKLIIAQTVGGYFIRPSLRVPIDLTQLFFVLFLAL